MIIFAASELESIALAELSPILRFIEPICLTGIGASLRESDTIRNGHNWRKIDPHLVEGRIVDAINHPVVVAVP